MRITRLLAVLVLVVPVLGSVDALEAGPIVYIGLDPGNGHFQPEASPLMANAARFAGGSVDPAIGYLEAGAGFGSGTVGPKLVSEGFTNLTLLTSASLAIIDLTVYDVLYFGPTTSSTTIADYVAASAAILAYVNGSGGLVVEPNVFDASSWSWVPDAAAIGHSGATNVGDNTVTIVDPGHPVMQGLTSAGLSGWNSSIHSTFSTPAAAGYSVLAVGGTGTAAIIVKGGLVVPEPSSFALLGLGALGLIAYRRKRRAA